MHVWHVPISHASLFQLCIQNLGELWVQNVILAISAVIAILTISSATNHERRRATVDMVREQTGDKELKTSREKFRVLRNKNFACAVLVTDQTSSDFLAVRDVLNAYEFMASGMRGGAFDTKTYKRMYYTNVTRDWKLLSGFVAEYRKSMNSGTLYQDFEWLATKWIKKPLKQD